MHTQQSAHVGAYSPAEFSIFKSSLIVATILALLGFSIVSHAVPAFARQTGRACNACHFQHFPTLNSEGREFAASGYTDIGKQPLIEKEGLSLPGVLNASIFTKLRYQKANGTEKAGEVTKNSGELQFPDEFVLFFGGRVSEHVGFLLEAQLPESEESALASVKLPFFFGEKRKFGVVPYSTDGLGAAYGFELLSTGALRSSRIAEHRKDISAQQFVGLDGAAEGLAFVAHDPRFYVNYSLWSPNHLATSNGMANGKPEASYLRIVLKTPPVEEGATPGWDFGGGMQLWSGSAKRNTDSALPATLTETDTSAIAFDAQAQGTFSGYPLGVYLTYAKAQKSDANATTKNLFNANPKDEQAIALAAEVGIIPRKATLLLAYRQGDNGKAANNKDNAVTLGGTYSLNQNVMLSLNYAKYSGNAFAAGTKPMSVGGSGDQLTTLMLSAGF